MGLTVGDYWYFTVYGALSDAFVGTKVFKFFHHHCPWSLLRWLITITIQLLDYRIFTVIWLIFDVVCCIQSIFPVATIFHVSPTLSSRSVWKYFLFFSSFLNSFRVTKFFETHGLITVRLGIYQWELSTSALLYYSSLISSFDAIAVASNSKHLTIHKHTHTKTLSLASGIPNYFIAHSLLTTDVNAEQDQFFFCGGKCVLALLSNHW